MDTTCCIVGGGPAGMMLGLLLAKQGLDTYVLEKHADFFRDFRGDTIHPSTLEIMYELGILDKFLQLPHQKTTKLTGYIENEMVTIADFSQLQVQCPYIAFMPQWDFLNFIAATAKQYPNFHLLMETKATGLRIDNGVVTGVTAQTPNGVIQINSTLVVGADGRDSIIRQSAGLKIQEIGAPMDVFWFRLSRKSTDPIDTFGKFSAGKIMIMINRNDYWQCGYVIAKGMANTLKLQEIGYFKEQISKLLPFLDDRVQELKSWDEVKLLTVKIDRLKKWYMPGLLCIGDCAHAMSPVGGVGINLAIQDAVAAANIIATPLLQKNINTEILARVQKQRMLSTILIQRIQIFIQNRVIKSVLNEQRPIHVPFILRKLQNTQFFKNIVGYIIGMGIAPEHVQSNKTKKI